MEIERLPPLPEAAPLLSQQEHEILARSKRKTKKIRLPDTERDDSEPENCMPETHTVERNADEQPRISYKDKLTRASVPQED